MTAPYQSQIAAGRDGFAQLLHAEWTKFRSVRAWLIGVLVAALMLVLFSFLVAQGSHSATCTSDNGGNTQVCTGAPALPLGPGGEAVTDSYYFVNQTLTGDGTITARVTSLTGVRETGAATQGGDGGSSPAAATTPDLEPWSKTGLIITASTRPGSAYVAIMATGANGVRMQYDYTHDIAGIPGVPSITSPRWLRLSRHADTVTGYDSGDGVHWTKVGAAHLTDMPSTVPAGLFATSPDHVKVTSHLFGGTECMAIQAAGSAGAGSPSTGAGSPSPACAGSGPTEATGVFDQLGLEGSWSSAAGGWRGNAVTNSVDAEPFGTGSYQQSGARLTVSGSGDIAPSVKGAGPGGNAIEDTLLGAFAAMIVVIVLAALFMTGEYRRGLIRTTMTASPRRVRVLAAKAVVIGAVTFVAALTGAIIAVLLGEHLLRANGNYIYPSSIGTKIQVVAGTAALLAVTAIAALALGSILRRSAGAVTAVIVLVLVPYILSVSSAVPVGAANWLLRLTPAAAFAVQQSTPQYHQVIANYTPTNGYFPLTPAAGLVVLCAYTVAILVVAGFLLRRRDV
jgi:ABC-type transport system involved in multi-copper enzyme maturation permease subunit